MFKLSDNHVAALIDQKTYSLPTYNYRQKNERSLRKMELDRHVTMDMKDLQQMLALAAEKGAEKA